MCGLSAAVSPWPDLPRGLKGELERQAQRRAWGSGRKGAASPRPPSLPGLSRGRSTAQSPGAAQHRRGWRSLTAVSISSNAHSPITSTQRARARTLCWRPGEEGLAQRTLSSARRGRPFPKGAPSRGGQATGRRGPPRSAHIPTRRLKGSIALVLGARSLDQALPMSFSTVAQA